MKYVQEFGSPHFNSVIVLGGGIAGIQSALSLAQSGFKVYLVERSSGIGGYGPTGQDFSH